MLIFSQRQGMTMLLITVLFVFGTAATAKAQGNLPSVVQLPSISTFSYSGTVVVPDGGEAHLGSVQRSASGSSRRGLSRATGVDQSINQASVKVHIIDNDEIDRQLLGGTPEEFLRRQRAQEAINQRAINQHANGKQPGVVPSVATDPNGHGKALVRQARRQYRSGNQSAAFTSYRSAIASLRSENLRRLATAEFKRLFGTSADQALRMAAIR